MSSLVTNLSSLTVIGSTVQEIVNWVTTADGCVHTADTTRLNSTVESCRRRRCIYWALVTNKSGKTNRNIAHYHEKLDVFDIKWSKVKVAKLLDGAESFIS